MVNLTRTLNQLGKVIEHRYPYINNGGCCVYAAMVAEELAKRGVKVGGIVTDWDAAGVHIDHIRPSVRSNTVDNWQDNGISFFHIAVEYSVNGITRYVDTSGVKKPTRCRFKGMPLYKGRLTLGELKDLSRKRQGWNTDFNRRDIPKIRELVKYYLSVDESLIV